MNVVHSQAYRDASFNSLLQTIVDMAAKLSASQGALADANVQIESLTKRLDEFEQKK